MLGRFCDFLNLLCGLNITENIDRDVLVALCYQVDGLILLALHLIDLLVGPIPQLDGSAKCAHYHDILIHRNGLPVAVDVCAIHAQRVLFDLFPEFFPPGVSLRRLLVDQFY